MSKNAIHNFNLSIKNSADIKSSEHLTKDIIKELAIVSKEMSQQKDIVQVWQEQKAQNAATIVNNSSTSTEGGATNASGVTNATATASASTTPSASGGTISNPTVSTVGGTSAPASLGTTPSVSEAKTSISSAPTGGGVADTTDGTIMRSVSSVNTTSPDSGAEKSAPNLSNGTTAQTYTGVAAQQTLIVPQALQTNTSEPTIEAVKAEIKKKLDAAITAKDTDAIEYWTKVSTAFDKGAIAKDFDGKPDEEHFTEMYATLKKSNQVAIETQNFNWDIVRKKMIEAIDTNILHGKISKESKGRWAIIRKQLNDDKTNVANLFEQYDELFLLLKEVEGLDTLPNRISITTKTKIYPNLSVDKVYASIGKEDVYVFLREVNNKEIQGSAVNKGAIIIKNTEKTSFIIGESLEFVLEESFINQNKFQKENINWVVYKNKTDIGTVFLNEGTSFSYNFDKAGTYKVEAYGNKKGANSAKSAKTSAFVELKIVVQEIVITPPASIKNGLTRASTEEQTFKVALKNQEVKTLNPLQLYYQVENTNANKVTTISEEQELDPTGIVKLTMPNLGNYIIKVTSKDQYSLNQNQEIKAIKNFVKSIDITKGNTEKNLYLWSETNQTATFTAKTFIIDPATPQEKANVKWLVYDKSGKIHIPDGFTLQIEDNVAEKPFLAKGEFFVFPIPKKEGDFTIEAYSNSKDGLKSKSSKKIYVKHPQVTEAYWAYNDGNKKKASGFAGEVNHIKARIPGYINQPVRIQCFLNDSKVVNYYNDTKTNENGEINKTLKFDAVLQKHFGIQTSKTAKIRFELEGIQNGKPYLFKKNTGVYNNAVLNVITSTQITDVYFMYNGYRVTPFTQVPYGAKVTGVVKTLNMVGKEVIVRVYKNVQHAIYRGKAIVNNEGEATIHFLLDKKWHEINPLFGNMDMFYIGIEGIKSKLSLENGLSAIVGSTSVGENAKLNADNLGMIWGGKVSVAFRKKVVAICKDLWGEENKLKMANQLMICMNVETKGEFTAKVGYPNATGLIQFTETAIADMNGMQKQKNGSIKPTGPRYTGPDYKNKLLTKVDLRDMTEIRQLDFVKLYFQMHIERYKRTINNAEDMYMAIFAPIGVGKKGYEVLYDKSISSEDYKHNKSADGDYWDQNKYTIVDGKKDEKITKDEMTPRIKQSIHLGKMYSIDIDETRKVEVVLAEKIIKEKKITFSSIHPYLSTNDKANADDNINDAAKGNKVYTSEYGDAKGKQVSLSVGVLYVLHELSKKYTFNVSELTGGDHSSKSKHYDGTAMDINIINSKHVGYINQDEKFYTNFTKEVKEMGAKNVFHPYWSSEKKHRKETENLRDNLKKGDKLIPVSDHKDHIHIQF